MKLLNITFILATLALTSCNSKPKVIVADSTTSTNSTTDSVTTSTTNPQMSSSDMHQVTVVEVLQAERYTYLKVKEKAEPFWIATGKLEAKVGNQYFYRGGLLKTNFESQEHKKVFDKIYLVSEIIDAAAHPGSNGETHNHAENAIVVTDTKDIKKVVGAMKLSDLINGKEKFNGKEIIVAGKCVKANYGIMNKNWYHIQDGTKINGKNCDFTITSTENLPLGANIAFVGKLTLNKDFGSGYRYDIIMEDAKLK